MKKRCTDCRFSHKNKRIDDHRYSNVFHCSSLRNEFGAEAGRCSAKDHRYFEPVLKSGMVIKIRNLHAEDTHLFENGSFGFLDALRASFVLITSAKAGFWDIRTSNTKQVFTQIPEKIIKPLQGKELELAVSESLALPDVSVNFYSKCQNISSGFDPEYVDIVDVGDLTFFTGQTYPPKNQMEKYEFRGDLNIEMIVNSAIEDKKRSFVVMGKNISVVGILKNRKKPLQEQKKLQTKQIVDVSGPYDICEVYPYDVNNWMKILKQEKIDFEKNIKKQNRKIKKQLAKRIKNKTKAERFQVFTF